jgi:dTDP-4-dehydrorhamnose reductase
MHQKLKWLSNSINMANILVTGATGLLGSALTPFLEERGHQVMGLGHAQAADLNADLSNHEQTAHALDQAKPEVIINLVALTNVDRCETHPQEAYLLNVKAVENLCAWMKTAGQACHLIQISTDQVYDGPGPHAEAELTVCNFYAMSKLAGEFIAGTVPSTTLRTNFIGRSLCEGRISLTDWLHVALLDETAVNVFKDVIFSPLAISRLCDCIERCIVEKPLGIFNLGSRDGMSKADFAFAFAAALGLETTNLKRVNASSISALVARRPTDMRMNSERFERRMGLNMPCLIDEIELIAHDYR